MCEESEARKEGGSEGKVAREALHLSILFQVVVAGHHLFQSLCPLTGALPLVKGSFDCQQLIISGTIPPSGVSYPEKQVHVSTSVSTVKGQG